MISNDPGKPKTGAAWAKFDGPNLIACGIWGRSQPHRAPGERVVIERPMIYPRSPVPPNDIGTLCLRAGRIAQALCSWDEEPEWVPAGTWKATVPPDILIERVLARLPVSDWAVYKKAADELAEGYRHNLVDAIGLGRWALKLIRRGAA